MNVCKKHAENPVKIYDQCVGCELERLYEENKRLKQELEKAEKHIERIERAGYV